ncbi:MAG: hypothetical protein E7601_01805 [Ruminococcaceae bacterium]|nr:hypothetical protein [Oscillospiraceae bacterium]MBO4972540.1 hypothetical protein [Clostridia bacterium]MBQ1259145.1 hypothetical protein [Clostridia bacterium]
MFNWFRKEEPKVNYGKIIAITASVVLAIAGIAFAVVKYLEKKKYDEYLEELCDCDCDCDCDCCDDDCDCDCCDCEEEDDDVVEVETEEVAEG